MNMVANAGRLSVLSVEDDPDQRIIIGMCLGLDPDFDVRCLQSPAEALAALQQGHPDVMLLDVSMPGMSGTELARRLRAAGYAGGIIFVTASVRSVEIDRLAAQGALGVIIKPFDPLSFASTIRSMVTRAA